jgi:GMP synthase-like glutamine amidotransferase
VRALVISHDPLSLPGHVGERLAQRGVELDRVVLVEDYDRPHHVGSLPALDGFDLVVPFGAPYSVNDPQLAHVIQPELDLLATAHEQDVPVLGVCFGGQALAAALGGVVEPAPRAEIGWFTLDTDVPAAIPAGPWFEWHVDRFSVPPGAVELARSPVGPQAFRAGRSLGVQFHPEVDAAIIESWLCMGGEEAVRAEGLDPTEVLGGFDQHGAQARHHAHRLVDWFLDEVMAG